eukprot:6978875-Pyramimonas_sp.AAC.1
MDAGCLTKNMPTRFPVKVVSASCYGVDPDPKSIVKMVKKQLARARTNAIPSGKWGTESWLLLTWTIPTWEYSFYCPWRLTEISGTARSAG